MNLSMLIGHWDKIATTAKLLACAVNIKVYSKLESYNERSLDNKFSQDWILWGIFLKFYDTFSPRNSDLTCCILNLFSRCRWSTFLREFFLKWCSLDDVVIHVYKTARILGSAENIILIALKCCVYVFQTKRDYDIFIKSILHNWNSLKRAC